MRLPAPLLFAATALGILYLGLALALPVSGPTTALEAVRLQQLDALRSSYGTSLAVARGAETLDPDGEFLPEEVVRAGGRNVAARPSLLALAAGPAALVAGRRGGLLAAGACAVLALAASVRLARLAFPKPSRLASLAMPAGLAGVLATPILTGGALFEEWAVVAMLATLGLVALTRSIDRDEDGAAAVAAALPAGGIAAGALIGLACLASGSAVLLLPSVVIAGGALWGARFIRRQGAALLAGAILPATGALAWGWLTRGGLFGLGRPDAEALRGLVVTASPGLVAALAAAALLALPPIRSRLRHRLPPAALPALALLAGIALLVAGPLAQLWRVWSTAAPQGAWRLDLLPAGSPALALLPAALLVRRPVMQRVPRFLGLAAACYLLFVWALVPPPGASGTAGALLPAWPPLTIFLCGLLPVGHGPRAGRLPAIVLAVVLPIGLAAQLGSLRSLSARRLSGSALAARVEAGTPEGAVLLTDTPDLSWTLQAAGAAPSVFFVRPGADLNILLSHVEQAGLTSVWVGSSAGDRTGSGGPGREAIELGGGLVLLRGEADAGTRGFSRLPEGD